MRVLVVDDEPTSRLTAQALVEGLGHDCTAVDDGEAAWKVLTGGEADLDVVVTDWLMPGMDGLELCRRIRAQGDRYIYVIVVTSRAEREHVRAGMDAGADDYLTKPLDPFALETRLIAADRVTSLHDDLRHYRAELARLACTDPLTQLRNRLSLDEDLAALHARGRRYGHRYSLVMCDIDAFKPYNDTYGHQSGDAVLRSVADTLTDHVRTGDIAYRFGGEEFLIALPEQGPDSASIAAERIRAAIEGLGLEHRTSPFRDVVTVSVGVAAADPERDASATDVLARADEALYRAKSDGRNRVALAGAGP